MNYFIIVFKNTHDAMSCEKKLNQLNIKFRIMPTPTSITQSCGICIRIDDEVQMKNIVKVKELIYKGIFKRNNDGYSVVN